MDFNKLEIKRINNSEAKNFMSKYHYTKSCAKSTISYGFYIEDVLKVLIVYGQPSGKNLAKSIWDEGNEKECLELLRLFSFDDMPKNTESYCISKSIKQLKKDMPEIKFLVSYADTSAGHVGYIYQSSNWLYIGKSGGERKIFLDGVRQHRRDMYDKYGTSSIKILKEKFGDRFEISEERFQKNKYIYVVYHSKKEKKELYSKIIPKILEYPKGDIKYYDENGGEFDAI